MIKLNFLLTALLFWLQYSLWFGKNSFHTYSYINDNIITQQIINSKLKIRNNQLFAEIDDLNDGYEIIEEHARNDLSMIRIGESFYRLITDPSTLN